MLFVFKDVRIANTAFNMAEKFLPWYEETTAVKTAKNTPLGESIDGTEQKVFKFCSQITKIIKLSC